VSREIGAGVAETVDRDGAFPRLDDDQRARLRNLGRLRSVEPGEVLFAAGDAGSDGDRPLFLETSRPGIFAIGDVHSGSIKRVASAVGEGSMAVRLIHQRLAAL
jgi:NADPH-dependent glutamate synthase beta subunit-like oxidoreductase